MSIESLLSDVGVVLVHVLRDLRVLRALRALRVLRTEFMYCWLNVMFYG